MESHPDIQPKATEYISQMIEMIEKLIANDCAYISEKHVLFDVKKYIHYGCLSRRSKKEQIAGSRIEIAKYKEILKILFFGNLVKMMNLPGVLHGEKEDQVAH